MCIVDTPNRIDLVKRAFWLEWLTIAWMVFEAAVALWSAYIAQSITLLLLVLIALSN